MNRNNLRLVKPTIDDKKIGHRVDSLTIINYLVKCADLCLLLFTLGHFTLKNIWKNFGKKIKFAVRMVFKLLSKSYIRSTFRTIRREMEILEVKFKCWYSKNIK